MGGGWPRREGWLSAEELRSLGLERDAFLGVQILHNVDMYDGDSHAAAANRKVEVQLLSWWGGARRQERLADLFDADQLLALAEFLLPTESDAVPLDALFWDVRGLTARGVGWVARGELPEFLEQTLGLLDGDPPFQNSRQLPPLFKLAKVAEHAESLAACAAWERLELGRAV